MSNADVVVKVHGQDAADLGRKIEAIDTIARMPQEVPEAPGIPGIIPPIGPPDKPPVDVIKPYFDIGDGSGKAGDTVELVVEAGCRFATNGFHIGGGCGKLDEPRSGYKMFEATAWKLGDFLTSYLKSQGLIVEKKDAAGAVVPGEWVDEYWSLFQMVKHDPHRALPEEWWELALAFFSMSQERNVPSIVIPSGTALFSLRIKILEGTAPGEYDVTCEDEHYWTHSRPRRRDFLFTADRDSPFASGGITKVETFGGKITVVA